MIKKLIHKIFGISDKPRKTIEPVKITASQHGISPDLVSRNAKRVVNTLQDAGFEAYIVGGAVRDLLLGVRPKDFDVATNATPEQVRRLFRRAFLIGRRFQIVHVLFGHDLIEVTTFRAKASVNTPTDENGRLLRDNRFGTKDEDADRRDFTINAMYYNPADQSLIDYHGGMSDLQNKILRIIGDPEVRYREDPVRMLRIVRFAAKLGFEIEEKTGSPIRTLAPLINNIPAARLFDETLKLLMSGHAMDCLSQLRKQGLHKGLLPLLDLILKRDQATHFVEMVLTKTDERIQQDKPVSPSFLFAALLWPLIHDRFQHHVKKGEYAVPAMLLASDEILEKQMEKLAIQRRITTDMKDIWIHQIRFEKRQPKSAFRLVQHERFRAAYDFLLLRCESGELPQSLGQWWTAFSTSDNDKRKQLLEEVLLEEPRPAKKRRSRRGRRRHPKTEQPIPEVIEN